jgi:hypothetical protein
MPFSVEENQLIENLIKVELRTSEIIPVPINVMQSLIQVSSYHFFSYHKAISRWSIDISVDIAGDDD